MISRIVFRFKKVFSDSGGSVTLEASIILPVILLMLFSLTFCSMYIYQKLILLDSAVYTVKQRAATWDSSYKNLEDGYRLQGGSDGLYWRIFNDLSGSWVQTTEPDTGGQEGTPLVQSKMRSTGILINQKLSYGILNQKDTDITVLYKNTILQRVIQVYIKQKIVVPFNWLLNILSSTVTASAKAVAVEPAEYIRNVDLTVRYTESILSKMKGYLGKFNTDGNGLPGKWVASAASKGGQQMRIYHYPDCIYVKRIKPGNLIEFFTVEEAGSKGYYLCAVCAKRAAR